MKMEGGELSACDADRSRSYPHSPFFPHVRPVDALDRGSHSNDRWVQREFHPLRYGEASYSATTPADLAPKPETYDFIAANRARRRPRRIGHLTRAEFPGSTGEHHTHRWSAHPSPVGGYPTSPPHRVIQNSSQGVFDTKSGFPCFDGESHLEDYLDWEQQVDDIFYYAGVPLERQVRFVVGKLKGRASVWWTHMIRARQLEGRRDVKAWRKMKRLLREQFVSSEYQALLEQQPQECLPEFRSVKVFTKSEISQLRRQRGNHTWSSEVFGSFSCEIKPSEVVQVVEKKDVDLPVVTHEKICYNSAEKHMLKSNWPGFGSAMVDIHIGNLACLKKLSPVEFGDAHAEKIREKNSAMVVEQFDSKTLTTEEELSIAVTKGKQLVQHCDSLKQSLVDQTTELNKCVQELQHKTNVLEALEADKTKEVNRVLITYSSERDEKLCGFGEQLSHKEFEEKMVPILVWENKNTAFTEALTEYSSMQAELISSKRMLIELSRNIGHAKEQAPLDWRETSRPYYCKRFNSLKLKLKKKGSLLLSFLPKPGGIIQDIDNIACSYGERPNNIMLAISLTNQDITTFDAIESATEVDPSDERKFGVSWGYVLYILCNEDRSGMNLYLRNGGQLKFLDSWKRAILHQQNSCIKIEDSERHCLQIEGFNSLFFYRRWYHYFTMLDRFTSDNKNLVRRDNNSFEAFNDALDVNKLVLLIEVTNIQPTRYKRTMDQLLSNYGDGTFRLSQKNSKKATMKLKDYVSYMKCQYEENSLYNFDDKFGESAPNLKGAWYMLLYGRKIFQLIYPSTLLPKKNFHGFYGLTITYFHLRLVLFTSAALRFIDLDNENIVLKGASKIDLPQQLGVDELKSLLVDSERSRLVQGRSN